MTDENKGGIRDGMKQGLGVLSAFKEAVEETINEARERGDLSPDRAKEIMRGALDRAHDAADGARDRFDLVPRKDLDSLAARVRRLEALAGIDPRLESGDEAPAEAESETENATEDPGSAEEAPPGA
jgi:polyhydroxyalkanoate synthesis regulator phasin